jgi:7,8-dihydropterin-6-yl-methyl-4-(beta-D-ribofuranosyl)aminobenzene 5'-phosphate synthase
VSGFHLFNITEGNEVGTELIRATGEELKKGTAVYYTGHCTGDYAYGLMEAIMGEQLQKITTGGVVEI